MEQTMKFIYLFLFSILLFPSFSFSADEDYPAPVESANERINRLERQLTIMEKEFYKNRRKTPNTPVVFDGRDEDFSTPSSSQSLSPSESGRLPKIEEDMRAVRGEVEQIGYSLKTLEERLNKLSEELYARTAQPVIAQPAPATPEAATPATEPASGAIVPTPASPEEPTSLQGDKDGVLGTLKEGEKAAAVSPSAAAPAAPPAQPQKPLKPAKELYDAAYSLVTQEKFDEASAAFKQFIADYPADPLTANAYYWLGETSYTKKDFDEAAVNFLEGYKIDKTGSKAPDNLLKLAMSLGQSGKTKEACTTLAKAKKDFPDAAKNIKQSIARETKNLKCK